MQVLTLGLEADDETDDSYNSDDSNGSDDSDNTDDSDTSVDSDDTVESEVSDDLGLCCTNQFSLLKIQYN